MYTSGKTGISFKTFIISFIFIIVFALLLLWLVPMPKYSNENQKLTALDERVFVANIQDMKNASTSYFTTDKLPQRVDDSTKLTLREMLNLKLLIPFTDKNGNKCDSDLSYVLLTKKDTNYVMKVNLKCQEQEDFIQEEMGSFPYCTSTICENIDSKNNYNTNSSPSCSLYINEENNKEWNNDNITVSFKSKESSSNESTITSYGLGESSVADFNENDNYIVSKDGITTVYGYVKDSTGKTSICSIKVKKDTVSPKCELTVLSGIKDQNDIFVSDVAVGFANKIDSTSGIESFGLGNTKTTVYNSATKYTLTTNGTHVIYGFVKDYAGNVSKCEITISREKTSSSPKQNCALKVTSGTKGSNDWYIGNVDVSFSSKGVNKGATIKGYGIGLNETFAGNSSYTINNDGNYTVYGYVKDSNGYINICSIPIRKDSTKPSCALKVIKGTYNINGYYTSDVSIGFDIKMDNQSGISSYGIGTEKTYSGNSEYTISKNGNNTVYGYVKDKAGNENYCSIKIEKRSNLEYQYKKDIDSKYSEWSSWNTLTYDPTNPPSFGNYQSIETVDLGKNKILNYYREKQKDPVYQNKIVKVGSINQTYCVDYDYYKDINTNTTYAIKTNSNEDWKLTEMVSLTESPIDEINTKYEFAGFDWECDKCELIPKINWNKYTRTVYRVNDKNEVVDSSNNKLYCSNYSIKEVELYDKSKVFVTNKIEREPVYKEVYTYKERTRTLINNNYTDYKWSSYNNSYLLSEGYEYTGNTRIVG